MRKNIFWIAFVGILVIAACKKEELKSFDMEPGITFYKSGIEAGRDSLTLSFAVEKDDVASDTVDLPVRIVGKVAEVERIVQVKVDAEKTTAAAQSFEILPTIIAAGEYMGVVKVIIKRSETLKNKEARLWLYLDHSASFQPGPKELNNYLIKFNDYLSKPVSWDEVRFGDYSQAKYGLIIRESGYSVFSGLRPDELLFIVGKCRLVLFDYMTLHGTEMLDENEVPVRFP